MLEIPKSRAIAIPGDADRPIGTDLRALRRACIELGIATPPHTVDTLLRVIAVRLGIPRQMSAEDLPASIATIVAEIEVNRGRILELCGLLGIDLVKPSSALERSIVATLDLGLPQRAGLATLTRALLDHFDLPGSGNLRRDLFLLAEGLRLAAPYWITDCTPHSADLVQFYREVADRLDAATIKNPIALLEDCSVAVGLLAPGAVIISHVELRSRIAAHFGQAGASLAASLDAFLASVRPAVPQGASRVSPLS